MEQYVTYILKILYYLFFSILVYIYLKNYEINSNNIRINFKNTNVFINKKFITIITVLIFCLIFGYYGVICGYGYDRQNYGFFFSDERYSYIVRNSSLGLYYFEKFLHIFSYNEKILFFTASFLCSFIAFISYFYYVEKNSKSFFYLILSNYFIYFLFAYKQAFALAISSISIAAFLRKDKKIFIISLLIAIYFHESAIIIIPILIMVKYMKYKYFRLSLYISIFIFVIFFKYINSYVVSFFSFIPYIDEQLKNYLDPSKNIIIDLNIFTSLKGIPYYIITFIGLRERKELKTKIKKYDEYLFMSIFTSFFTLISVYMYFFFRFALYFYFPVFIFATLIINKTNKKNIKKFLKLAILFSISLTLRYLIIVYFKYGGI